MKLSRMCLLLAGAMAIAATGCADKNTPPPGPSQAEVDLRDRLQRAEADLARAMSDRERDANQIAALQAELDRLRKQLAERPPAEPAPGWSSVPGGAMTSIEGTLLFDSGKATLKPGARQTLERVADAVHDQFPDYDVYVFGHTDDEPIRVSGWKDNYELSAQRALSVVRRLREMGIENKMAAAGWGDQLPIAANSDSSARQRNRRVEIYAMAPEAARGKRGATPPTGAGRGGEEPALDTPEPRSVEQPRRSPARPPAARPAPRARVGDAP